MVIDKQQAALSSVFAAIFLTGMKLGVGFFTGSLGILSEALHSTLDLCAAVITFFTVRVSDKPADVKHHYGHGKLESFSALIETILLFITCGWIIYEAGEKLFLGKTVELVGIHWGVLTMLISIAVDYSRVRVLKKAAKQHASQALEADALHFSSDVWSSSIIIAGLVCVWLGNKFNIPFLKLADPIAALGVALLVIKVSIHLAKDAIDVLLDTAPRGMKEMINKEIKEVLGVLQIADIRVRAAGAFYYIDVNIGTDPSLSHGEVHAIVHEIRERIYAKIPRCDIIISTFPAPAGEVAANGINPVIRNIIGQFTNCTNVHNIHVYEIDGKKKVTAHIELKENLTLKETHDLAHKISQAIQQTVAEIDSVNIYFECAEQVMEAEDITEARRDLVEAIRTAVNKLDINFDCHAIRLYGKDNKISSFLHCGVRGDFTVDKLEAISNNIKSYLKKNVPQLDNVHIHFEPWDSMPEGSADTGISNQESGVRIQKV